MDAIALRSAERILAIAIGGLAVYLGYRLFLALPEQANSEGKVVLPGNISVYLSRVGPGAFFALFGAIVVASSLYFSIKYSAQTTASRARGAGRVAQRRREVGRPPRVEPTPLAA